MKNRDRPLNSVFGKNNQDKSHGKTSVYKWFKGFEEGREYIGDVMLSSRRKSVSSLDSLHVIAVRELLDKWLSWAVNVSIYYIQTESFIHFFLEPLLEHCMKSILFNGEYFENHCVIFHSIVIMSWYIDIDVKMYWVGI